MHDREVEGGVPSPVARAGVEVCALLHEQPHALHLASQGSQVQRRPAVRAVAVEVEHELGAAKQLPEALDLAVGHRTVQVHAGLHAARVGSEKQVVDAGAQCPSCHPAKAEAQQEHPHGEALLFADHRHSGRGDSCVGQHGKQLRSTQGHHHGRDAPRLEAQARRVHKLHDVHHEERHAQQGRGLLHWVAAAQQQQQQDAQEVVPRHEHEGQPPEAAHGPHEGAEDQDGEKPGRKLAGPEEQVTQLRARGTLKQPLHRRGGPVVHLHECEACREEAEAGSHGKYISLPGCQGHRVELRPVPLQQCIHGHGREDRAFQDAVHGLAMETRRHHGRHGHRI
mmetsp:Transcript_80360/g.260349  ORF Transcript_80360/g.260349 Transcript_80360/m.260349 type:complete len:338 (+) Transcript_80360:1708-2721(+)